MVRFRHRLQPATVVGFLLPVGTRISPANAWVPCNFAKLDVPIHEIWYLDPKMKPCFIACSSQLT
jgi:hypothetical protein